MQSSLIYYRHISLLTVYTQILEYTMHKTLSQTLRIENILVAEQFGFKKGMSTENAMQKTTDSLFISLKTPPPPPQKIISCWKNFLQFGQSYWLC